MARIAQCECGCLRITVEAEPTMVGICSCLNCQRRSGSVFAAVAYFPSPSVKVASGQYKTFTRGGSSGGRIDQHFCPECGTTVFWDAQYQPTCRGVAIGCFADPLFPPPQLAVYDRSRHPWVILPPGIPVHKAGL
jgi:hypothetical protein